jgi:Protein of unknown function (DUF3606)
MTDDKKKPGPTDSKMISLAEDSEVREWARKFNVTPADLRAAVGRVGYSVKAVEKEFKKRGL